MHSLKLYAAFLLAPGLFVILLGVALAHAVPFAAAEAIEEAIRGAQSSDEVRSRIAEYYLSHSTLRLLLFAGPGVIIAALAGLCLRHISRIENEGNQTSTRS